MLLDSRVFEDLQGELQRLKDERSDGKRLKPDLPEPLIELAVDGFREVEDGQEEVDRDGEAASQGPGSLQTRDIDPGFVLRKHVLADVGARRDLALLVTAMLAHFAKAGADLDGKPAVWGTGSLRNRHMVADCALFAS